MALPARRPTAHGVKTRSVRSVALFETDAALVTELIPSWHGARDENVDSQEGSLPEITVAAAGGAVPGTLPRSGGARNLQQLRQVLREVGGRKVQQEALVEQQEGVPGQPRQRKARSSACDTATLCAQRMPRPLASATRGTGCWRSCDRAEYSTISSWQTTAVPIF